VTDSFAGNGAEIICAALRVSGVNTLFGVPGDTGVALYDALAMEPALRHVLLNDERGAVFAADAYARRSGRVGVAEVSSGGGATFCIGGMGEARAAGVPLVVISSDIHRGSRGTGALTETDQAALFSAVTKAQHLVDDVNDLGSAVVTAFREAASGRPGPVVVIVPEDLLDERGRADFAGAKVVVPFERPAADAATVQTVAAGLLAAREPVFLVGGGVHLSGAYAELLDLAVSIGARVATSIHGKGTFDETHPLSLGVCGGNGARVYSTAALKSADYVLLIGTRANATDTDSFTAPPRTTDVVTIDIDSSSPSTVNYPGATRLVGDARTVLAQLLTAVRASSGGDRPEVSEHPGKAEWQAARESMRASSDGLLHPWEVMEIVRAHAPAGLVIVADCGTPTPYLASYWEFEETGRSLVTPRGHGPMGYAMPGAVGAALANGDAPVVVFTTDGSMIMAAGALESAARLGRKIVYVQFTNGSLGWIKALQHFYHDGRYFGTQLSGYDPSGVARGFGIPAVRVSSLAEFETALKEAFGQRGPSFIDVPSPDEHDVIPPVASWERVNDGSDLARPVY